MSVTVFLPVIVCVFASFMLFKLRFFFLLHPIKTFKRFFTTLKDRQNRRSLYLALSGTLGVGNIFGVGAGLIIGGAGSVFWLMLSALFSMVIKFSETTLAATNINEGRGTHFAFKKSFEKSGGTLSVIYAFLCLCLAFFMGAAIQSRAICESFVPKEGNPFLFFASFCMLIIFSVIGGGKRIEKITSYVIPMTTIIYIILSLTVIVINFERLGESLMLIFNSAFCPEALSGGIIGFTTSQAIKEGFMRGILSNEAGLGTSAMAHSASENRTPAEAGLYGMCEVFFDTLVLCPLTAFVILTSRLELTTDLSPMALIKTAVIDTLGESFAYLFCILVFSFGYSTVTCWYYYGGEYFRYLSKNRYKPCFVAAYFLFIFLGVFAQNSFILSITDLIIFSLTLLVTALLFKERKTVSDQTKNLLK